MPQTPLKTVLYVEDDEALARLLQKRMSRQGLEVTLALSAEDALSQLETGAFDLLLVDYNLPGMSGMELLETLKQKPSMPPLILLTAGGDERIAIDALEMGAADYAVKDVNQAYLDLLPAVMQSAFTKERLTRENERQRQELQDAKERAEQASQAKSDFLATMSHEIRTPLNVVTGLASILSKSSLNDEQYRIVETLRTNADILLRLINDLLDIARIEERHMVLEAQPFDPSDILRDIRAMFEENLRVKGLGLIIRDEAHGRNLVGDRIRIEQVVMNLVSNAIKFTTEGELEIAIKVNDLTDQKAALTISVRDTGIGIDRQKLNHIFEKFTQADASITRRFGGSGLGLAIAQALIELMGGKIRVTSEVGHGSLFEVELKLPVAKPAVTEPLATSTTPHAEPIPPSLRPRVLLVEDYEPNIMVATLLLEDMGYQAIAVDSGLGALEVMERSTEPFHAVLMDVQMHGMDGFETTRRLREIEARKGFRNPVIGVTAHGLSGDRTRCLEAGMDDYLSKPILSKLLAQKLKALEKERVGI